MQLAREFKAHALDCRAMAQVSKEVKQEVWLRMAQRWLRCAQLVEEQEKRAKDNNSRGYDGRQLLLGPVSSQLLRDECRRPSPNTPIAYLSRCRTGHWDQRQQPKGRYCGAATNRMLDRPFGIDNNRSGWEALIFAAEARDETWHFAILGWGLGG